MACVLLLNCYYSKSPQIQQFKQQKFIILEFCRSKVQHGSHWTKIKESAGLHFLLEAPDDNPFSCFFQNIYVTLDICRFWGLGCLRGATILAITIKLKSKSKNLDESSVFNDMKKQNKNKNKISNYAMQMTFSSTKMLISNAVHIDSSSYLFLIFPVLPGSCTVFVSPDRVKSFFIVTCISCCSEFQWKLSIQKHEAGYIFILHSHRYSFYE